MKLTKVAVLLAVVLAIETAAYIYAQVKPIDNFGLTSSSGNPISIYDISMASTAFSLSDGSKTVMQIGMDGQVTFGKGFTPNAATKEFVRQLESITKQRFAACPPPVTQTTTGNGSSNINGKGNVTIINGKEQ